MPKKYAKYLGCDAIFVLIVFIKIHVKVCIACGEFIILFFMKKKYLDLNIEEDC